MYNSIRDDAKNLITYLQLGFTILHILQITACNMQLLRI